MRPLKLTMSAFGSYVKKTEVDFTLFGDKGIYLITGDTGSGKTTIFDALSYALFGSGSGELRNSGSIFRSKYASINDETFVELEFLYNDKVYIVRRNPEYQRASKKGDGVATQKLEATLTMPSGRIVSGDREVSKEILNLLGVDKNQFSQIVMLPQGSFMKFLMANTTDKQKIFQDIFKTHLYKILQENINDDALKYKNEIEDIKKIVFNAANEIICPNNSAAYNEISEIKNKLNESNEIAIDIILENINIIKSEQLKLKKLKEKSREDSDNSIAAINKEIGICEKNNSLKEAIEKNLKIIKNENERLLKFKKTLENAENDAEICQELSIKIDRIVKQFSEYEERDKFKKEQEKLNKNIRNLETEIKKDKKHIEENSNNISKLKCELDEMKGIDEREIELNNLANQLKNRIESINKTFDKLDKYNNENGKLKKEQEKLKKHISEYEKCSTEFIQKEQLYDKAIAGILAEKLAEGQMCPVCGSVEHPEMAVKPENTPTEQQLKELDEKRLAKENEKNKCREKVNGLIGKTEVIFDDLKENIKKIFKNEISDIDLISEKLKSEKGKTETEIKENNNKLKNISEKKLRRKKIETNINDYNEENVRLKNSIENMEKERADKREKSAELKARIDSVKLDFDNLDLAKTECSKLKNTKKTLEQSLNSAKENYNSCERKIKDCEVAVKTAKEQIDNDNISLDINELENKLNVLNKNRAELNNDLNNINHIIETNNDKENKIKDYDKNIRNKNEKYKYIKELSDLVNGKIKKLDADQITLEVRVQMVYFERIIRKANVHLLNMTDGQYELVRRKISSDGRMKFGLDLDILDHFNQSFREVKTLSGGESFKASLALALGMADEIQTNSGGIQIDSFFIDEGFGSLDDESLNQAINTLNSLVNSNRLIGIISHVSELKDRIDKKIIVSKNNYSGSKIKIEY